MRIRKGAKLVIIGDSITDAGKTKPEGLFDPLGRGYVTMIDALLGAGYPHLGIRVVNQGVSGHTVRDLAARWQTDVLDQKPQWLAVMIGINDVWRQFDCPRQPEWHVYLDEYERTLDDLLARTRPALEGLVLATPYFIEPNRKDPMRATMDKYGAAVKRLADKHDAVPVDTQAVFDRLLKAYHSAALAWDRVHPTQVGHMALAKAFVDALGFQWS